MSKPLAPIDDTMPAAIGQAMDEEGLNGATHGLGILLSMAALGVTVGSGLQVDVGRLAAVAVFAVMLVVVYAFSTFSHLVREPQLRFQMRVWDQGTIYLLIAGTYTPLMYAFVPPHLRWWFLAGVWVPALIGLYAKVVRNYRVDAQDTWGYIALGWVPAAFLVRFTPAGPLPWIVLGGVIYSIGTYFLINDGKQRGFHAIWHLMVIAASGCHFFAVWNYCL